MTMTATMQHPKVSALSETGSSTVTVLGYTQSSTSKADVSSKSISRSRGGSRSSSSKLLGGRGGRGSMVSGRQNFDNDEFMAAAIGDVAWLKQSLKSGRDPSQFDRNGLAAIHLAALHGRLECLKLLVEKYCVDINLPSSTGWRPVHLAINSRTGKRSLQCLQYLIDQSADTSLVNDDEFTPAHQAAIEGSVRCLEVLIKSGAPIHLPDEKGHLPVDYAKIWGHRKCARILASESWKQAKDYEAGEMEKLKFFQTLKEENDKDEKESRLAESEFYGSLSFTNWLDNRGLKVKPTGPPLLRSPKPNVLLKSDIMGRNKLYKANAMTRQGAGPVAKERSNTAKHILPSKESSQRGKRLTTEKGSTAQDGEVQRTVRPIPRIAVNQGESDDGRQPCTDLGKMLDLPSDIIERVIEQKPSPHDRPLEFKCKNIIDAQHRRLFPIDVRTEAEMYAHISDCSGSKLFPGNGLVLSLDSCSRGSETGSSEVTSWHEVDAARVAKMMKNLSKPIFPAIKTRSHKYSFEIL